MVRTVTIDVVHRLTHVLNDLAAHDVVSVLGAELVVAHELDLGGLPRFPGGTAQVDGLLGAAEARALLGQRTRGFGQELGRYGTVDQQGLGRIAHGGILRLGIHQDAQGHVLVCIAVHENVADTGGVAHDGNARMVHDVAHELVGSAGNEEVDVLIALEELVNLAVQLRLEERALGQTRPRRRIVDDAEEHAVGVRGLLSTLQDGAVAALDAQGGNLDQRVGPCLEDDADDANWAGHALHQQTLVQLALQKDLPHGIVETCQLPQSLDSVAELALVVAEALLNGRGDARGDGGFHVLAVGRKDLVLSLLKCAGNEAEGGVAHLDVTRGHQGCVELHLMDLLADVHVRPPRRRLLKWSVPRLRQMRRRWPQVQSGIVMSPSLPGGPMAKLKYETARFESSYGTIEQLPEPTTPEVSFVGRSNVGKSSLLNKLIGRKSLAKVSSQPGKTANINFFDVDGVRFVDLPGYGFAKVSRAEKQRWADLIGGYFDSERSFNLVVSLVDIRHDAQQLDRDMLGFLVESELPFVVALTKADKLSRSKQNQQRASLARQFGLDPQQMLVTSSETGQGIAELRSLIEDACL